MIYALASVMHYESFFKTFTFGIGTYPPASEASREVANLAERTK